MNECMPSLACLHDFALNYAGRQFYLLPFLSLGIGRSEHEASNFFIVPRLIAPVPGPVPPLLSSSSFPGSYLINYQHSFGSSPYSPYFAKKKKWICLPLYPFP
jgi:hypothetical protein